MPSSISMALCGFFLIRKRRTWDGANTLVTAAGRALSEGRARLRLLLFVFADGNIASEDSSLSDALVLEDGRLSVSCLRAGSTDETGIKRVCNLGQAPGRARARRRRQLGPLQFSPFPVVTDLVGSAWAPHESCLLECSYFLWLRGEIYGDIQ